MPSVPLSVEEVRAAIAGVYSWESPDDDNTLLVGDMWWRDLEKRYVKRLTAAGIDEASAVNAASGMRREIQRPERYFIYDDTFDMLRLAHERGYLNILLTNNHPDMHKLCETLGLVPYLDGYAVSGLIGYDKPRREIFRAALDMADNPEPSACLMVGDNPVSDIAGAEAAGIPAVLVHKKAEGVLRYSDNLRGIEPLLV